MTMPRFNPPPPPSTPDSAPWEHLQALIARMDALIQLMSMQAGIALNLPGATPSVTRVVVPNKNYVYIKQYDCVVADTGYQLQKPSHPIADGYQLTILAKPGNTGLIYVGMSKGEVEGVDRIELDAGIAASLKINDINLVFVAAAVAGEGVCYWVEETKLK